MDQEKKIRITKRKPQNKSYAEVMSMKAKIALDLYNKTLEAHRLQAELESEKRVNSDFEKLVSEQRNENNALKLANEDLADELALCKGSREYVRSELEHSKKVFRDNQEAYEKTINALRKENRDLLKGEELKDKIIDALGSEINTHLCSLDTAKNQIAQLTQKIAELMRPAPRRILFGMEHANAKQAEEIRVLQAELIERDNLLKELRDRINRDI